MIVTLIYKEISVNGYYAFSLWNDHLEKLAILFIFLYNINFLKIREFKERLWKSKINFKYLDCKIIA